MQEIPQILERMDFIKKDDDSWYYVSPEGEMFYSMEDSTLYISGGVGDPKEYGFALLITNEVQLVETIVVIKRSL